MAVDIYVAYDVIGCEGVAADSVCKEEKKEKKDEVKRVVTHA